MPTRLLIALTATVCLATPALATSPASKPVMITSSIKSHGTAAGASKITGTFTGTPFGTGKVVDLAMPAGDTKLAIVFTATFAKGTITGTASVDFKDGKTIRYSGSADIIGGTKTFKGAHGAGLKVTGTQTGKPINLTITGRVTLPHS